MPKSTNATVLLPVGFFYSVVGLSPYAMSRDLGFNGVIINRHGALLGGDRIYMSGLS